MKYSSRVLSLLAVVSSMVFFASCDKGEGNKTSKQDEQIEKLVGTWEAVDVDLDNTTPDGYDDFKIVITGDAGDDELGYTASGRPDPTPWPQTGSFSFGSNVLEDLIRDNDDLAIDYEVTGTTLTLSFTYEGDGFDGDVARTTEIGGDWTFTFQKAN